MNSAAVETRRSAKTHAAKWLRMQHDRFALRFCSDCGFTAMFVVSAPTTPK